MAGCCAPAQLVSRGFGGLIFLLSLDLEAGFFQHVTDLADTTIDSLPLLGTLGLFLSLLFLSPLASLWRLETT